MKKASESEEDNPENKLNQMAFLLSGWLTNSSINSALL
jgi:hypothetical protein